MEVHASPDEVGVANRIKFTRRTSTAAPMRSVMRELPAARDA